MRLVNSDVFVGPLYVGHDGRATLREVAAVPAAVPEEVVQQQGFRQFLLRGPCLQVASIPLWYYEKFLGLRKGVVLVGKHWAVQMGHVATLPPAVASVVFVQVELCLLRFLAKLE